MLKKHLYCNLIVEPLLSLRAAMDCDQQSYRDKSNQTCSSALELQWKLEILSCKPRRPCPSAHKDDARLVTSDLNKSKI
jgi:hypothetical protein